MLSTILNQNTHPKLDLAFGNHDIWQEDSSKDQGLYNISKQNLLDYTGAPIYIMITGYRLIIL